MSIIEAKGLTRRFNGFTAVDHVSFEVEEGEVFGFLGPNGAGKTTTIKMLTTLLKPTEGSAKICGYDIVKHPDKVRRVIGIVFQDPALDDRLTGRENLDFHARLYGLSKEEREHRIEEALRLVGLGDRADELVENYSGGMKRRLEIARGLIHYPKVLFLDEPTLGLDVQTRRAIWDYIVKLNREEGVTIFLTTHYMEEADYLSHRVAIIDHGRILAIDKPKNLKDMIGGDVVIVESHNADLLARELRKFSWVKEVKARGGEVSIYVEAGEKRIPEIIIAAEKSGANIESVTLRKPTLEDVYLHFTGKSMREEEASIVEKMRNLRARRRWRR